MLFTYLFRNPRILLLANVVLLVAGSLSLYALPRMEDPQLTPRAATITTFLPGADAERVEALVTEKIEEELKEIEEIKEVSSVSRQGVSVVTVKLKDVITKAEASQVWGRLRDQLEDARLQLPPAASRPEFKKAEIKAFALILGLKWESPTEPRYGLMRRLTEELKTELEAVAGTEKSELFGDPDEEVLVSIDPLKASALGLRPDRIAKQISAGDAKSSAGQLRGRKDEMLVDIDSELQSLEELSGLPIQSSDGGVVVRLADIATIERSIKQPVSSRVLVEGEPAVVLGVYAQAAKRLDFWRREIQPVLSRFEQRLPPGIGMKVLFDQEKFVSARMESLLQNLIYGVLAVFVANLLILGWRGTWIVCISLPLSVMAVLFLMRVGGIPVHQMSITGLIISMGLVVDNAIVVVDEVRAKLMKGLDRQAAVQSTCKHLAVPLLGATVTTILSFAPIALMPGPSGEFVGSIAKVAIASVATSLVIGLTIIAALSGLLLKVTNARGSWISEGITIGWLTRAYQQLLEKLFGYPLLGIGVAIAVPILGFLTFPRLPEQFFPAADRGQFQIEIELPGTGAIEATEEVALAIRNDLLQMPEIREVTWFLGENAAPFYYNLLQNRKNSPRYGQAMVDCQAGMDVRSIIHRVQGLLRSRFPEVAAIALQLEQGPPFAAPIEVRLFGPDAEQLRKYGEELRLVLAETPDVLLTRSDFSEQLPKVGFVINREQARLAGLNQVEIAAELNSFLEGNTGGSILEDSEELPIRVRMADEDRRDLASIASLDLLPEVMVRSGGNTSFAGIPLGAISEMKLLSERAAVRHFNGKRMNEIQGFIPAGVLPAVVQKDFKRRLEASGFTMSADYSMRFAGAEAERNDALGNLIVNVVILIVTMITAIVITTNSFRLTIILFSVAFLSMGAGIGGLYVVGLSWGFMAVVGIMGMIGIAVNDSIVVMASLKEHPLEITKNAAEMAKIVVGNTRHVVATTLTTVAGFTPLFLSGSEFWGPVAICISCGVFGATLLALVYIPCMYRVAHQYPFTRLHGRTTVG